MKSQIDQLRSEAEANFSASRWEDSAKTYEHLVGLAQNNHEYELAIDFAISAIRAWSRMPDKKHRINRLYQAVGLIGIKKAAIGFEELAKQAQEEKDFKSAAGNYEEAGNGYSLIQSFDKAKGCYENSINYLENMKDQKMKAKDFEASIHLLERISSSYSKIQTLIERILVERKDLDKRVKETLVKEKKRFTKSIKDALKQKASTHELLAKQYCDKNEPDCDTIAVKEYEKAISILESIGETTAAKKIKGKINKMKK